LLVTADHHDGKGVAQGLSGLNQQRGLAGAGAGDQIQHQHAAIREQPAVAGGELGVFRQNVLFQADPARFGSVVVNRAARVVVVGVLSLGMGMGDRLAFAATASSTHLFDLQLLDSHFVTAGQPPLVRRSAAIGSRRRADTDRTVRRPLSLERSSGTTRGPAG